MQNDFLILQARRASSAAQSSPVQSSHETTTGNQAPRRRPEDHQQYYPRVRVARLHRLRVERLVVLQQVVRPRREVPQPDHRQSGEEGRLALSTAHRAKLVRLVALQAEPQQREHRQLVVLQVVDVIADEPRN